MKKLLMKKTLMIMSIITLFVVLIVCNAYASDITLRWDANTETDLAGYKVYYGSNSGGAYNGTGIEQGNSPIILTVLDSSDPNYVDNSNPEFKLTGLDFDANDYYLVLTAYDTDTNESGYSNEVNTIGFNIPSIPQNLIASVFSENRIDLTWDTSTDNKNVIGYNIYRDGTVIGNSTANSYSDTTVVPNVLYSYTVTSLDEDGNESGASNVASAMTNDTTPPSIPQNLKVSTVTSTTIGLEWEKSTDNVGVIGYDVYRNNKYLTTVLDSISDFISYIDINLLNSTLYTYTVLAGDTANNKSNHSNFVSATTLAGNGSGGCFISSMIRK